MALNTKRLKRARIAVTVTLPPEALELADALANQRGITRSAVIEELIFAQLRPRPAEPEQDPLELMEGSVRTPLGTDPERDRKLQEAWREPPRAQPREHPILPSRALFEAFSKSVANAEKGLPELRLTDVAALEEIFASATSVAGDAAMYVFERWTEAYVADAETPTPSGLLMNLHRYISIRE